MTIERTVILSILKLTEKAPSSRDLISKDARIPVQATNDALQKMSAEGLIKLNSRAVEASPDQRVKLAIRAIRLGIDFEKACRALSWDEFESIAAAAFSANGFTIRKRFRFKHAGRRWEIDVIGCKEPMFVCADCKHWRHGWGKSASMKAVDAQVERTEALTRALPIHQRLGLADWRKAIVIPMILSLIPSPSKFHNNTPIVPILQLQNFLNDLPAHINTLKHFSISL